MRTLGKPMKNRLSGIRTAVGPYWYGVCEGAHTPSTSIQRQDRVQAANVMPSFLLQKSHDKAGSKEFSQHLTRHLTIKSRQHPRAARGSPYHSISTDRARSAAGHDNIEPKLALCHPDP